MKPRFTSSLFSVWVAIKREFEKPARKVFIQNKTIVRTGLEKSWKNVQMLESFSKVPVFPLKSLFCSCAYISDLAFGWKRGQSLLCVDTNLSAFMCEYKIVSIRTKWLSHEKRWGLYQKRVNSNLASIQRLGHLAQNCKIDHSHLMQFILFTSQRSRGRSQNTESLYLHLTLAKRKCAASVMIFFYTLFTFKGQ